VVTPSFFKERLIGFFACTSHVVDIGGIGFTADANSVYEEGLYIPVMKFADKGTVNKTFLNIVRVNVRETDQVVGDLYALMTCNEVGQGGFILENSRRATLEKINALKHGRADGEMMIDGYHNPIKRFAISTELMGSTAKA